MKNIITSSDFMNPEIFKLGRKTRQDVYESLASFGYRPKKKKVFIKPNIVGEYRPGTPYITNLKVVEGLIEYLQDIDIDEIAVGEGPVSENTRHVFNKTGYKKLCKKTGVALVDLYETERIYLNAAGRKISIPRLVLNSEYINISKLKTHSQTGVTLCLKNQKGLLTLQEKRSSHRDLHRNIAKLYSAIKPDLSMVDATSGVEGNGPGSTGNPVKNINLLVIGTDALKVDFLSSMLMGMDPMKIEHLRIASGKRRISFPKEVLNELSAHKMKFKKPTDHDRKFNFYYWFTDETCSGCTRALIDLNIQIMRNPLLWPIFFYNGILRRVDILSGKSDVPEKHGKVVCVGNCTRELARKHNLIWVPGCPPRPMDIIKKMT